jgi:hypothetical protein
MIYLTDNRLGYPSWSVMRQRKGVPAHHEREELRRRINARFPEPVDEILCRKRIFNHFGMLFGVLICSELTDIKYRQIMRGNIDALFILCWNQDLESNGTVQGFG